MRRRQQQPSRFKTICVFCGSRQGKRTSYHDAAIALAQQLVSRGIDLVYGGGGIGLMGLVSQSVHRGGRRVVGVIPRTLMATPEIIGETAGEVIAVADMHQRKAEMARQSDAFIALPGGYGTLEELLEMITWAQLGIHRKPVGLLNVDGYYDSLLAFIDQAVEDGFISPSARGIIVQAPTAQELMDKLEEYVPYYDRELPPGSTGRRGSSSRMQVLLIQRRSAFQAYDVRMQAAMTSNFLGYSQGRNHYSFYRY